MKVLNNKTKVGLVIILFLIIIALFAPYIATSDPAANDLTNRLKPPGQKGLLGTDHLGRDVFSRVVYGTQLSIGITLVILIISTAFGLLLGLLSGYYRGFLDSAIMVVVEMLLAFPSMILALVVVGIMGPGLMNAIIAISLVSWIGYTRLVRGMTLSLKEREFVKAAKISGSSDFKIITRHILPNVISSVVVYGATNISTIIMQLAALSFLGLGLQPPTAEWGNMLSDAKGFITVAPWLTLVPSFALILMITGFNLFGEGLTQILNLKQTGGVGNGNLIKRQ